MKETVLDIIKSSMARVKIDPCPKAGEGVNQWVNLHVLRMLKAGNTDATIYKRLISAARGCGRDPRNDITHSIETGRLYLGIGKGFGVLKRDYHYHEIDSLKDLPPVDLDFQRQILTQNQEITLKHYQKSYRENIPIQVLWHLFHKNKICIGYSRYHTVISGLIHDNSIIRFANKHINLHLCQFIVPSPMVGDYAINKTGKRAVRCLNNTCQRWFLVIEFDHLESLDDQVRLHYELAKECELRMLVYSGNKSIHGWFDVYHLPEKEIKNLMKAATRLGADPMTWIRCQYVRFPGGTNEHTKKKQEILYYNYE